MIAKIFSRSNPMIFLVCMLFLFTAFVLTLINKYDFSENIRVFSVFPFLVFSVFLTDFITKKNKLNKNDCYAVLLFTILLLLIPESFLSFSVALSNLFVLLAFRKLVSLQSLVQTKQKIVDASIWIAFATVFEFWAILFFILVFLSILIHVSSDFKNWLIPFVGAFAVAILVILYAFIFDFGIIDSIRNKAVFDFFGHINSFSLGAFLAVFSVFLIFQILHSGNYLATLLNSVKKVLALLIIGLMIYLFSAEKNNGLLLYCITPLSIIGANFINSIEKEWAKNTLIYVVLILGIISFYLFIKT